jgi:glycosyltransferase involved in cell wall biosynthesis
VHVLVVTVVHHPEDARIRYRQIPALMDAGHRVTYVAPFDACAATPPPDVTAVSIPRATGRSRLTALRAARAAVRAQAADVDIVLIHDPELVLVVASLRRLPPVVWDVHEDTAATVTLKPWLPPVLRPATARAAKLLERFAERRYHVILADSGYRHLFRQRHPVVPNTTYVPETVAPPGDERVIYVGHLTRARGAEDMIEVGRLLDGTVRIELVGDADATTRPLLERAHADGTVVWHGFLPNDAALRLVEGSLAGLSLLHDEPNYRNSLSTKAVEYMARGVPVITTPTGQVREVVEHRGAGIVVPFDDPKAAAEAVVRLREDPQLRVEMGRRGHETALAEYAWPLHAKQFVAQLESWAATRTPEAQRH